MQSVGDESSSEDSTRFDYPAKRTAEQRAWFFFSLRQHTAVAPSTTLMIKFHNDKTSNISYLHDCLGWLMLLWLLLEQKFVDVVNDAKWRLCVDTQYCVRSSRKVFCPKQRLYASLIETGTRCTEKVRGRVDRDDNAYYSQRVCQNR